MEPWVEKIIDTNKSKWLTIWRERWKKGDYTPFRDFILIELDKEIMKYVNEAI